MSELQVSELSKTFGAIAAVAEVDLSLASGEVVVLLGPSGCGKTTLLRTIAGLVRPDGGTITLGGRVLDSSKAHVAPEDRSVGLVFQNGVLFPHLSVARNVGFGLPRPERRGSPRIDELLELVGLADAGDRMPETLSGGQAQRVALARALAPRPSVLLMDEPFSNLDAVLRTRLRREISEVLAQTGTTTLFVTHDREEAFAVGDRVAVMSEGRIRQIATPEQVYRAPVDPWVSGFVGDSNLVDGLVADGFFGCDLGRFPTDCAEGPARILLRPEDLQVLPGGDSPKPAGDGPVITAEVVATEYVGPTSLLRVTVPGGELVARHLGASPHHVGELVRLRCSLEGRASVYPGRP